MNARREGLVVASGDTSGKTFGEAPGEFAIGDEIEAWYKGTLYRHGRITEVIPSSGRIWISEAGTGARTLLDPDASDIVRRNPPT